MKQRQKDISGRPGRGVRPELSCPAEMHILYTLRLPTSSGSQNIYIWGKLFSCNPFSEGEKYGIMTRWQTMFIGDSATAAFPARGAVFFRACGVPAARVGAAVSVRRVCPAMPGEARQSRAKPGNAPRHPARRNGRAESPQPSDAHGAARKLPDVKNIFI